MVYFFYFFIFILGLCVGSFLNVVIDRWPKGLSLRGRSVCEHCHRPLFLRDLIPLISWLGLRGRCRFCQQPLSRQYPLVELATGLLFLVVVFFGKAWPANWSGQAFDVSDFVSLLYLFFIVSVLVVIFMIDLKEGVVLEAVVFPAIIIAIIYRVFLGSSRLVSLYLALRSDHLGLGPYLLRTDFLRDRLLGELRSLVLVVGGAAVVALVFWLIIKLTRGRGMGLGDVWLGFLVGLVAGFPEMMAAIFLAFILGAAVSLGLLMLGRKRFGETVPFGPFLSIGTLLTLFFGGKMITWYLHLL